MTLKSEQRSAGDSLPSSCVRIEVHVGELRQLFDALDPSPFRERDLDPKAEEFIVGWAKEAPRDANLGLVIYLDRAAGLPDEATALRDAVQEYFKQRALVTRRRLRELLRRGRVSLLIGLITLSILFVLGDLLGKAIPGSRTAELVRESLLIGGWVAMWRPLEIFLYDWWPILREARLFDRLASMPVRIVYKGAERSSAWQDDWPAAPVNEKPAKHVASVSPREKVGGS